MDNQVVAQQLLKLAKQLTAQPREAGNEYSDIEKEVVAIRKFIIKNGRELNGMVTDFIKKREKLRRQQPSKRLMNRLDDVGQYLSKVREDMLNADAVLDETLILLAQQELGPKGISY